MLKGNSIPDDISDDDYVSEKQIFQGANKTILTLESIHVVKGIDKNVKKKIEEGKVYLSDISPVKNAEIEEAFLKSLCDNASNKNIISKKKYYSQKSSKDVNIKIEENYRCFSIDKDSCDNGDGSSNGGYKRNDDCPDHGHSCHHGHSRNSDNDNLLQRDSHHCVSTGELAQKESSSSKRKDQDKLCEGEQLEGERLEGEQLEGEQRESKEESSSPSLHYNIVSSFVKKSFSTNFFEKYSFNDFPDILERETIEYIKKKEKKLQKKRMNANLEALRLQYIPINNDKFVTIPREIKENILALFACIIIKHIDSFDDIDVQNHLDELSRNFLKQLADLLVIDPLAYKCIIKPLEQRELIRDITGDKKIYQLNEKPFVDNLLTQIKDLQESIDMKFRKVVEELNNEIDFWQNDHIDECSGGKNGNRNGNRNLNHSGDLIPNDYEDPFWEDNEELSGSDILEDEDETENDNSRSDVKVFSPTRGSFIQREIDETYSGEAINDYFELNRNSICSEARISLSGGTSAGARAAGSVKNLKVVRGGSDKNRGKDRDCEDVSSGALKNDKRDEGCKEEHDGGGSAGDSGNGEKEKSEKGEDDQRGDGQASSGDKACSAKVEGDSAGVCEERGKSGGKKAGGSSIYCEKDGGGGGGGGERAEIQARIRTSIRRSETTESESVYEESDIEGHLNHGVPTRGPEVKSVLLRDLITTYIMTGNNNARIQLYFQLFARCLKINELLILRIEENLAADLINALQASTNESSKRKNIRRMKIAAAALGGGALIAFTAGLAAPGIIAGLTALGAGSSSLTAFLASASGLAFIVSLFGAGGAGLTGYKYSRRIANIRTFEFIMLNGTISKSLSVCVCVSGEIKTDDDITTPWIDVFPNCYCDLYGLKWENHLLKTLGSLIETMLSQEFAITASKIWLQYTIASTLSAALTWPLALIKYASNLDNVYLLIRERAQQAGRILADALSDKNTVGQRPVILIGYSVGARVIFYCLKYLYAKKLFNIVSNAIFIGLPATTSSRVWERIRMVVTNRVINVYSKNDWLLGFLYRYMEWKLSVAGLISVNVPNVENYDASGIIHSHLDYKRKLKDIFNLINFDM
ncbi:hypothetical protein POVWA1_049430 [Plasmodium ovale wallikeri]|uniref:Uncharacterized protein n=1 Tax=Plasmodium ovale wallikeri TaxID=864142 RepID=A0A1A8ZK51_PLAOA|nr:hypothetical protein POVWA1_049430 [Plasmodium ovale wallikeri]